MVKTGVVEGTVKTASADNAGDAIGAAAKCIAAAREATTELSRTVKSLSKTDKKDDDKADK